MKVKVLKTNTGREGMLYKGHLTEVSDSYAKELIKKGYVEKYKEDPDKEVEVDGLETGVEDKELEAKVDVPDETKEELNKEEKKGKSLDEVKKLEDLPKNKK